MSKTISTLALLIRGPVPSCSTPIRCSDRRCENSSLNTNWIAATIIISNVIMKPYPTKEEIRLSTAISTNNNVVLWRKGVDARHFAITSESSDVNLKHQPSIWNYFSSSRMKRRMPNGVQLCHLAISYRPRDWERKHSLFTTCSTRKPSSSIS